MKNSLKQDSVSGNKQISYTLYCVFLSILPLVIDYLEANYLAKRIEFQNNIDKKGDISGFYNKTK